MPAALVIYLAMIVTMPFSIFEVWDSVATFQINRRVRAMRQAGEPTSLAELAAAYPEPPEGQNAAPILQKAFDLMEKIGDDGNHPLLPIAGNAKLPAIDQPIPPAMRGASQAYLTDHAEVLELLHQAAEKEGCKFPINFEDGIGMQLPHLSKISSATRLLALEAIERTEEGKAAEAADSLVAALRLGHALARESVLISGLVRVACDSIAARQVERWASQSKPSPEALERVEAALQDEADPTLMHKVIVAERCFGMDMYRTYALDPKKRGELGALGVPDTLFLRVVPRAYFKSDLVAYIDLMSGYAATARLPYPQSLIRAGAVGKTIEQRIPRYFIIARMLLPVLGRVFIEGQRHMARLDSARVGLTVLRYRAQKGKLPDTLDALAPDFVKAVPVDPFNGKPLLYRTTPQGFTVYSLGENGKDDGGQTERVGGRLVDVGFRVLWPKARF
ncbi:MAG: hypothetical protein ISS72_11280 [Candidatus Brocadiae bacterium]|nr:hypothetical protein [Candidatus Brocadiia bacterium]